MQCIIAANFGYHSSQEDRIFSDIIQMKFGILIPIKPFVVHAFYKTTFLQSSVQSLRELQKS